MGTTWVFGTISIRETVFMDFCYDVAHSFVRQGYDRLVLVNGHGSNQMLCNLVSRRIDNTTKALCGSVAHWWLAKEKVDELRECFPRWYGARARVRNIALFAHFAGNGGYVQSDGAGSPVVAERIRSMTICSAQVRSIW